MQKKTQTKAHPIRTGIKNTLWTLLIVFSVLLPYMALSDLRLYNMVVIIEVVVLIALYQYKGMTRDNVIPLAVMSVLFILGDILMSLIEYFPVNMTNKAFGNYSNIQVIATVSLVVLVIGLVWYLFKNLIALFKLPQYHAREFAMLVLNLSLAFIMVDLLGELGVFQMRLVLNNKISYELIAQSVGMLTMSGVMFLPIFSELVVNVAFSAKRNKEEAKSVENI